MMFDGCQTGDPCVLPFRYKNVTYDGCTTVEDPEDKLWCSTKVGQHTPLCLYRVQVDSSGVHQRFSKTWGHCAAHCPGMVSRLVMSSRLSNSCVPQRRQSGPCPSAGSWRLDSL